MKEMIAYCGLNCEKCNAHIATVTNDNALREETARLWSELNQVEITPEMISCMGCRTDGVKTPYCDSMCEIRKCAMKKGLDSCARCDGLKSCEILRPITDNSEEALQNLKNPF